MKISTTAASAVSANVDLLAVAVTKPVKLEGAAAELDGALGGAISRLVKANEIRGAAGQVTVRLSPTGNSCHCCSMFRNSVQTWRTSSLLSEFAAARSDNTVWRSFFWTSGQSFSWRCRVISLKNQASTSDSVPVSGAGFRFRSGRCR